MTTTQRIRRSNRWHARRRARRIAIFALILGAFVWWNPFTWFGGPEAGEHPVGETHTGGGAGKG